MRLLPAPPRRSPAAPAARDGFSLLEVLIALLLVALIGTSAAATIREGIGTMEGTENSGRSVGALSELHQFTLDRDLIDVEALDGQTIAPILGTGDPLPGADDLLIDITVVAVDDTDINFVVAPADSLTRRVTATVTTDGQLVETASWVVTEN